MNKLEEPFKEEKEKRAFYYWLKNPENNEQQVKKRFLKSNDNCKRSILGVNKSLHWIDEFNIGSIMHMNEIKIIDFEQNLPIE